MRLHHPLQGLILVLLALSMVSACEAPRAYPPPIVYYYVSPSTTFLRSCPSYGDECVIVATVYSGDRVELLDRSDYGWSRVRLDRSGAVGWIPSDLLSLSPLPATYYVTMNNVYLRECGDHNCRALELLYRGDRVEKIDQDNRGWWRVTSFKTRATGWIPVYAVSPRPGPPYYYVNVTSLALRAGPSTGSRILATLRLNDQVELLGTSPTGWGEVRVARSGIIGWVAVRYLETFPVSYPKPVPKKAKPPSKKEAPPEEPEETPKPPTAPKAM